jgi:Ca-activated chloride channel family protein
MTALVDSGEIKQIVVVTESENNSGINSIEAAGKAYEAGITVSTIGIVNSRSSSDERQIKEVEEIARAGGGLCEFSGIEDLDGTIQKLVRKTARRTIEQIVARQLKSIIGQDIENLELKSRIKIVDFIEKYGENINLKCILVLDTNKSMGDRLDILKKSAVRLYESLQDRRGRSSIAVMAYPGENNDKCSVICDFTSDVRVLGQKLDMICSGSAIPAAPAILKACELMHQYYEVWDSDISG